MNKNECSGIWVFAEQRQGKLDGTVLELLGKSQELKKTTGEEVVAVLLGSGVAPMADTLAAYGADKVIVVDNANLKEYSARPYQKVLVELCEKYKPSSFLFGATSLGRDLAPRVMCKLGTGLTADAVELGFDGDGAFVQTTPAFGGALLVHIAIPERRPQMVTVRAHVFDVPEPDLTRKAEVVLEDVSVEADPDYVVIESICKEKEGIPIDAAEILVAGGRGIKKQEDIALLKEFADLIGGEIACSRPLVDEKWLDHDLQIGQSGVTVKPKYIFNFGISGSVQYIVGMQKAQNIITVNTYNGADLFPISHYGAVADLYKLLPAVIAEIKRRKKDAANSCSYNPKGEKQMSERKFIIPEFGPLAGMRVICSGSLVAMPFAATMLADFGAEIIHIERPGVGDTLRMLAPFATINGKKVSTAWAQDARNKLSLSLELNLKHEEVKELFYGLIKEADVFMENMVWLEKLGIYDEELLKVNPKLVIVHVSGMGHKEFGGVPSVCNRASYDMIGQAFSGWMDLQGEADADPAIAKPYTNDFVSAFATLFGTMIAYTNAQKTGVGQVVDIAQFEAMAQYMCGTYTAYTMAGIVSKRTGNFQPAFQPYNLFKSSDGFLVALGAFGPGVYKRCIPAMGIDVEYYNYKDCSSGVEAVASEKGRELNDKVVEWCAAHTAQEIETIMEGARVPCATVNNAKSAFENEHFNKRNDWIKYVDQTVGEEVTAFGIAPKLSVTPGQVWRGAPSMGQDTDAILKTILGYDDEKIADLRSKKLI